MAASEHRVPSASPRSGVCLSRLVSAGAALVALAVTVQPCTAAAVELGAEETRASVEVHGFVSQGYIKSSANNYLANSARGSFEFAEVGINFTSQITDRLRVGIQLFTRDLGPLGNYSAKMDWFYLDYRVADWLGIRAGRVKLPFGLYNDIGDIDSARVPILLPQSVYPLVDRDFLLAQTGLEIYGYLNLRALGALEYRLYVGTIFIDLPRNSPGQPFQITQISIPYVVGGRLAWETPVDGLRLAGSVQALRVDVDLFTPATSTLDWYRLPAVLWVTSAEYAARDLLLSLEYGRWHVRNQSSDPALLRPNYVSEQAYVMGSYRLKRWLQPGVYYSVSFLDVDSRTRSRGAFQLDGAATLRFDINDHWIVKVEGHYMHGTGALQPQLNGAAIDSLTKDWVVGLVKTTAYF